MSAARLGLLALLLVPATARAGNNTHPRTPVLWEPRPACMTIVDRNESAVLQFGYAIPLEDLKPMDAGDEVETSRRHQFLGFCRHHSIQEYLPSWLSDADVADADAKGLLGDLMLKPEEVMDTNPMWNTCMVRITGDDERRLITFAEAAMPVVWDTTGLPVGAYTIEGYTWEPPGNIFSPRPGVIKIIDDPDPAASPPALAIDTPPDEEPIIYSTEQLRVHGCISAMDGSTISGFWAKTDHPELALDWQNFAMDVPVSGDEFELMFAPPPGVEGNLVLRVDITDPMDRTYTGHMLVAASVLPGAPPMETEGDDCGAIFVSACTTSDTGAAEADSSGAQVTEGGESSGAPGGSTGTAEATGATTSMMQTEGGGCGCATGSPVSLAWLGLVCVRRRRRVTSG